jgi:hypothetical protein
MPCLFVIIAAFFPRLALIVIALMTSWFSAAFNTRLWPILGFIFMPYTTLACMGAMLNNNHTVSGGWLAMIIVAVFLDLGTHGGSTRRWQTRRTT